MPSSTLKRRGTGQNFRSQPPKRIRRSKKQNEYHSSSEDEDNDTPDAFTPVNLDDSDEETVSEPRTRKSAELNAQIPIPAEDDKGSTGEESEGEEGSGDDEDDSLSETSTNAASKKRKRNDPEAFATSISKILGSKLSTSKRADPVLARSQDAAKANRELSDQKLEIKARHKIREEKRAAKEKDRVKDVLGLESEATSTQQIVEREKRLKKTAQRGVIKLFNAVRAAQVKGEEAAREAQKTGMVGIGKREDKVSEMSKKGFLDFIAGGGKKAESAVKA